jgi:transposase
MQDASLFPGMEPGNDPQTPNTPGAEEPPRLRRPDRRQILLEPVCLDERLAAEHPARAIWAIVEKLDLSRFEASILARGDQPGRAATDPRLLAALWLVACTENVGSARELDRLCREHDAYRWLCGGVSLNYHTLSDFRVGHGEALNALFTDVLTSLLDSGVVQVARITQDGTRVRASAGAGSFRRRARLEELRAQAAAHVAALQKQVDDAPAETARQHAARQRAAREREQRVSAALAAMTELEQIKADTAKNHASKKYPPRASTTDPQARRMRLPEGGFAPAYNVQLAEDPESRAIVAVDVVSHGTDHGEDAPLRAQVLQRTGQAVREHIFDGGYVRLANIEQAARAGTAVYAPILPGGRPPRTCLYRAEDSPGVAAWRARMRSAAGRVIYALRWRTSETVNADLKTFRGLRAFTVRGLARCRCVVLWAALAYNVMHFGQALLA